jgi:hypothetical protein
MSDRNIWTLITGLALLSGAGLIAGHFQIVLGEPGFVQGIALASAYAWAARHLPSFPRIAMFLVASAQLTFLGISTNVLSYMAATPALPFQDAAFARIDAALGWDWPAYYRFFVERPTLLPYTSLFYNSIALSGLIPIVLAALGDRLRLQRFVLAAALTLAATIAISAFVPAMGAYFHHGLDIHAEGLFTEGYTYQLARLPFIRDGSLRVILPSTLGGVIMFPSFHAAVAVLIIWALWSVWWLRPVVAILGGGMLLATPLCGGHYFIDVLAGSAIAVLSILVTRQTAHFADGERRFQAIVSSCFARW